MSAMVFRSRSTVLRTSIHNENEARLSILFTIGMILRIFASSPESGFWLLVTFACTGCP